MKYSVVSVSNGNFSIVSESDDKEKEIVNFHSACTALWNAQDVNNACVAVVDEKMVIHKIELIKYPDPIR